MPDITGKKVLIVIAYKDYQDHELKPVKEYLSMFGAHLNIASTSLGTATGKFGGTTEVDCLISDIHPEHYNAAIFIGGPGVVELQENLAVYPLIEGVARHCQVVAAICLAPILLAKAGVLKGKKATIWTSYDDNSNADALTQRKVRYSDKNVVVDGKFITANGPDAADLFARTIVDNLAF